MPPKWPKQPVSVYMLWLWAAVTAFLLYCWNREMLSLTDPALLWILSLLLEINSMLERSDFLIQNNHVNLCLVLDSTTLLIVFQSNILPGQCSSVVAISSILIQNKCYHGQYLLETQYAPTRWPAIFQQMQCERVMMYGMRGQGLNSLTSRVCFCPFQFTRPSSSF